MTGHFATYVLDSERTWLTNLVSSGHNDLPTSRLRGHPGKRLSCLYPSSHSLPPSSQTSGEKAIRSGWSSNLPCRDRPSSRLSRSTAARSLASFKSTSSRGSSLFPSINSRRGHDLSPELGEILDMVSSESTNANTRFNAATSPHSRREMALRSRERLTVQPSFMPIVPSNVRYISLKHEPPPPPRFPSGTPSSVYHHRNRHLRPHYLPRQDDVSPRNLSPMPQLMQPPPTPVLPFPTASPMPVTVNRPPRQIRSQPAMGTNTVRFQTQTREELGPWETGDVGTVGLLDVNDAYLGDEVNRLRSPFEDRTELKNFNIFSVHH